MLPQTDRAGDEAGKTPRAALAVGIALALFVTLMVLGLLYIGWRIMQ